MEPSELLPYLIGKLESLGIRYFVTGSTASILYGEPRFTNDIDVVVDLPVNRIEAFVEAFPPPTFYVSRSAAEDAVRRKFQFNVIAAETGMKIDVIVASDSEYDRLRMERANRLKDASGIEGSYASPEDVIIMKLRYYREGGSEKHLRDIGGILKTTTVDRNYIAFWATKLDAADDWTTILNRIATREP